MKDFNTKTHFVLTSEAPLPLRCRAESDVETLGRSELCRGLWDKKRPQRRADAPMQEDILVFLAYIRDLPLIGIVFPY